ncbi:hypothetical protein GGR52DRAFT_418244 [Hypoxylon sp. FL1284]|nr:hypothetical protein GGR52DRAFT_418244 [Hypoxylon sp. FL1284]
MASTGNPTSELQQGGQIGKTNTMSDGSVVTSTDPTTNPDASMAQKLKGDASGAVKGTVGSMQAAAGAAIRNHGMEEKGRTKMQEEDERLAAKRGHMPVGSGQRHTTTEGSAPAPQ